MKTNPDNDEFPRPTTMEGLIDRLRQKVDESKDGSITINGRELVNLLVLVFDSEIAKERKLHHLIGVADGEEQCARWVEECCNKIKLQASLHRGDVIRDDGSITSVGEVVK